MAALGPRGETGHGRRHHEAAARQRRPLRTPDPPLEPEDEAIHLHRAQRHLHHRPAADAVRTSTAPTSSSRRPSPTAAPILFVGTKRQAQEAIAEQATRVGMPYVNQRWLGGMLTNFQTVHKRLQRLKELEAMEQTARFEGRTKKEMLLLTREKDKLEKTLGGIRDMAKVPERRLDRGHQEGAHRRRRGPQAEHPGGRDPRHQLRPGRGRLPDPGQRRRDPLRRAADQRDRRRRRRRPHGPLRARRGARGRRRRHGRAAGRVGARAPHRRHRLGRPSLPRHRRRGDRRGGRRRAPSRRQLATAPSRPQADTAAGTETGRRRRRPRRSPRGLPPGRTAHHLQTRT